MALRKKCLLTNVDLKHIAILVRNFTAFGGLEGYNFKLIQGLLNQDFEVTVICEQNTAEFSHKNLTVYESLKCNTKLKYSEKLKWYYHTSNNLLQNHSFDLIHSQQVPTNYANVVTFHNHTIQRQINAGTPFENLVNNYKAKFTAKYKLQNYYDEILAKSAQSLIFPSFQALADYRQTYQINSQDNLFVAYPGLEPEINLDYSKDQNNILFIGKGYRRKGLDILLKAVSKLIQDNIPVKLNIIGLKLTTAYKLRLKILGLENNVFFHGSIYNLKDFFAFSDIIVQVSRIETFGMSVLEAMQYHVLPVVSRNCGISEIFQNDVNGIIINNYLGVTELSEKLKMLITNQSLRHKIVCNAQELSHKFSWDKTVTDTLKAYEYALKEMHNVTNR